MMVGDVAGAPQPIAIVPLGADAARMAMKLAQDLREGGFYADLGLCREYGQAHEARG